MEIEHNSGISLLSLILDSQGDQKEMQSKTSRRFGCLIVCLTDQSQTFYILFYNPLFSNLSKLPGLEKGECITSFLWGKFVSHTSSTLPQISPEPTGYRSTPVLLQAGKAAYSIEVLEKNPNDSRGQKEPCQRKLGEGLLAQ